MKIDLSLEDLTIGELADFEDAAGMLLADIAVVQDGDGNTVLRLPMKARAALLWISERRKNPQFTLDDARNVKLADIESD